VWNGLKWPTFQWQLLSLRWQWSRRSEETGGKKDNKEIDQYAMQAPAIVVLAYSLVCQILQCLERFIALLNPSG
jgi:hypothetical protein